MSSFPLRVMIIQWHISFNVKIVAQNVGRLEANEHDWEEIVSYIFFCWENLWASWGWSWIEKLEFNHNVTHILSPVITWSQLKEARNVRNQFSLFYQSVHFFLIFLTFGCSNSITKTFCAAQLRGSKTKKEEKKKKSITMVIFDHI